MAKDTDRRSFVVGTAAVGTYLLTWCKPRDDQGLSNLRGDSAALAGPPKVRKHVAALTADEIVGWRAVVAAMKSTKMKDLPGNTSDADERTVWRAFAEIHQSCCPHGSWFFLPWHRAFLYWFEQVARTLSSNPNFTLPYWDWGVDSRIPAPLVPAKYTNAGQEVDNPLYHANRNPLLADGKKSIEEWISDLFATLAVEDRPERNPVNGATVAAIAATKDFFVMDSGRAKFLRAGDDGATQGHLESEPHNWVHVSLGDQAPEDSLSMAQFLSPLDPIFWLHHCNIDRIWDAWMMANPTQIIPWNVVGPPVPGDEDNPKWLAGSYWQGFDVSLIQSVDGTGVPADMPTAVNRRGSMFFDGTGAPSTCLNGDATMPHTIANLLDAAKLGFAYGSAYGTGGAFGSAPGGVAPGGTAASGSSPFGTSPGGTSPFGTPPGGASTPAGTTPAGTNDGKLGLTDAPMDGDLRQVVAVASGAPVASRASSLSFDLVLSGALQAALNLPAPSDDPDAPHLALADDTARLFELVVTVPTPKAKSAYMMVSLEFGGTKTVIATVSFFAATHHGGGEKSFLFDVSEAIRQQVGGGTVKAALGFGAFDHRESVSAADFAGARIQLNYIK